jgi:hypothetical protein
MKASHESGSKHPAPLHAANAEDHPAQQPFPVHQAHLSQACARLT